MIEAAQFILLRGSQRIDSMYGLTLLMTSVNCNKTLGETSLDLSLSLKSESDDRNNLVGLKRTYRLNGPKSQEWIDKAIDIILSLIGQVVYFNGRLSLNSSTADRLTHSNVKKFRTNLVTLWKTNSLAFNIDGKNLSIRFDCSFEFDELALEVEAITPQKSESVLISIQQGLDLEIADAG